MKKTFILLTALSLSLVFSGCGFNNLGMPKSISVKTNAKYEFSVMNFDSESENSKFKLSDYFDLAKMLDEKTGTDSGSAEGTTVKVYKYNSGVDYQQFLVHMSLPETEFDLSEAFKDLDVSNAMSAFDIDPIKFKIDPIDNTTQKQHMDVTSIRDTLNLLVTVVGTTDAEVPLDFPATFTELKYKTGKLVVTGELGNFADGSKVSLYDGTTKKAEGTFSGNEAEIDVSDILIKKDGMSLKFTDTSAPGFKILAKAGSVLWYAEGVTYTSSSLSVSVSDITLPAPLPDQITQCTVGEGSLTVDIRMPSETDSAWSDIITDYKISLSGGITGAGGTAIECSKTNKTFDLADAVLTDADITASTSNLSFELNNANLYFCSKNNKNKELKPEVDVTVDVTKVSATVKLDNSYANATTIHEEQEISSELRDYIERIYWNPSGFDITAKNTLPAGNNITLGFASKFLGMGDPDHVPNKEYEEITITAGGASAQSHTYQLRGEEHAVKFVSSGEGDDFSDPTKKIDIDGKIGLNNYDSSNKTFDVVDVAFGQEYEISISITPVFDWDKADVKLPSSITSGYDGNMSVGINKKTLFESVDSEIADNLSIKEIPLYVFATMPDVFDGFEFQGKMGTYYGTKQDDGSITPATDPKRKNLFGNNAEYTNFATLGYTSLDFDPMPAITKNANDEVKTNFGTATIDLAPSINDASTEGNLCIEYNIKLADSGSGTGSTQITKAQLDDLKDAGKASIKIDLVLILSMDFRVADGDNDPSNDKDLVLDLMKIMKKENDDLLGRSEATDTSSYNEYIKLVTDAKITVTNLNLPIIGEPKLLIDPLRKGVEAKKIKKGGSYSVSVNPSDLLKEYPLKPIIQVTFDKGSTVQIPRKMAASGKIKLNINAD